MNVLLGATNIYFNAMCAFFAVMCIIGFCLIRTDKKRWVAQKNRSDAMMSKRKKAEDAAEEETETAKGKKGKKEKKPKKEEPFEYEARVPDKALFAIAILFGAAGELLAMLIYRHKWYKFYFRTFIPILTVVNLIIAAVILYFLYTKGDGTVTYKNW